MRALKGFALFMSLMLVFLISIFAFWLMLVTQSHYAASRSLFESENARITSEAAVQNLVLNHNYVPNRFFFDSQKWNSLQLIPFEWNRYEISGSLAAPWSPVSTNQFSLRAAKKRYASEILAPVRQIRLEDFALFSDSLQSLSTSTLFDGKVFIRPGLFLDQQCRFRDVVYNDVSPASNALLKRTYKPDWIFPSVKQLFPSGWNSAGLIITAQNPLFWQGNHYVLDLNSLDISASGKSWNIRYKGTSLGKVAQLILLFDGPVSVHQTYAEISRLPSVLQEQSFFIHSINEITIESSIQNQQGQTFQLAFCFVSEKSIRIASQQSGVRIAATIVAMEDLFIDAGSVAIPEKQSWISEIRGSAFLMESNYQQGLIQALNNNQKVVWFRGSVAVEKEIHISVDLTELHFEARRKNHVLVPSFPFIEIVEGGEQWL